MDDTKERVHRRRFLEWVGSAAVLVGCGDDASRSRPRPPPDPTPEDEAPTDRAAEDPSVDDGEPASEPTRPATDADWAAMAEALDGDLVRPDDGRYARAKQLFDPRFDDLTPQGIAYCRSESDVQRTIAFSRAHGIDFAARCGGHSYGGYSSGPGIVCDVGPMASVDVDGQRATIGAGAKLIDIYARLAPRSLILPGGTCPSVGIAGLTLGGGQGVFGRKLGLTCDALRGMRMVTADGTIRACDAESEPDLFWASRGGGGGNFGVATRFDFTVSPVTQITRFALPFRWDAAADVLAAWQQWGPAAPDELWSKCEIGARGERTSIAIHGVFLGPPDGLEGPLDAFTRAIGTRPRRRRVETAPILETMLMLGGCARRTYEECHLPPEGTLGRGVHLTRSIVFEEPLAQNAIDALLAAMDRTGLEEGSGRVGLDALGGAIGRVTPGATAFVHRRARFIGQYATYWGRRAGPDVVAASTRWLNRLHDAARPRDAHAYQNYIDPDLEGWARAYYGSNLPRLRALKTRYDADGFFQFARGISAS